MSTDPYTPPETDVQVEESLPARPVLGISLAFLFSFIGGIIVSTLFSFAIAYLFNPDAVAADENADPTSRLRMVTNLYVAQIVVGLVIAFFAGFMCVRVARSTRWRYPLILMGLSSLPSILMMIATEIPEISLPLGKMVLGFVTILIGARVAMMKLKNS